MALTVETLKKDEALAKLSDADLQKIALLSANDEQSVMDKKVREIHDRYDEDIKSITGIDKAGGMKSYDHLKVVLGDYKKKAESGGDAKKLKDQITQLEADKKKLEDDIKAGAGDKSLVTSLEKKLKDKDDELKTVRTSLEKEKEEVENELKSSRSKLVDLELNHQFDKHLVDNGVKFKTTIPQEIITETLQNRKAALLKEINPDWIDSGKGDGSKVMVFRNGEGEIMRNEANGLKPFTGGELFAAKITDLVDGGKKGGGGGAKGGKGGSGGGSGGTFALQGAKTQVEADDAIRTHILKDLGIAKTSPEFSEKHQEIRNENNVSELPVR